MVAQDLLKLRSPGDGESGSQGRAALITVTAFLKAAAISMKLAHPQPQVPLAREPSRELQPRTSVLTSTSPAQHTRIMARGGWVALWALAALLGGLALFYGGGTGGGGAVQALRVWRITHHLDSPPVPQRESVGLKHDASSSVPASGSSLASALWNTSAKSSAALSASGSVSGSAAIPPSASASISARGSTPSKSASSSGSAAPPPSATASVSSRGSTPSLSSSVSGSMSPSSSSSADFSVSGSQRLVASSSLYASSSSALASINQQLECRWFYGHPGGSCSPDFIHRLLDTGSRCRLTWAPRLDVVLIHTFLRNANWDDPTWTMPFKSFLLTQNLSRVKMILWVGEDDIQILRNNTTFMGRFLISSVKEYVSLRVWNFTLEVRGTPLALHNMGESGQIPIPTYSDIVRLLLLHNYGGFWLDTDAWLVQDILPLADNLGLQFGVSFNPNSGFNNHVLFFYKHSRLARLLLEATLLFSWGNRSSWPWKQLVSASNFPDSWVYNYHLQDLIVNNFQVASRGDISVNDTQLNQLPMGIFDPFWANCHQFPYMNGTTYHCFNDLKNVSRPRYFSLHTRRPKNSKKPGDFYDMLEAKINHLFELRAQGKTQKHILLCH